MAEDSQGRSLPRRVPRDRREPSAQRPTVHLPESVVRRILGVLDDIRADNAQRDPTVSRIRPEDAPTVPLAAIRAPAGTAEDRLQPGIAAPARTIAHGTAQANRQWLRSLRPGRARPGPRGGRHQTITRAVISAIAVLSAGSLVFLLTGHAARVSAPNSHPADARSVLAIRDRAAAWVAAQVSRAALVSCDRVMCRALHAHGFPAACLVELRPGQIPVLRSRVLVLTAAVRSIIKSRAVTAYAPTALAGFGSGNTAISIRVIAQRGVGPYSASLRSDLLARQAAGSELLQNQQVRESALAGRQLGHGQVDSRLLAIIASLAARQMVSVVSFGDRGPGASAGVPFRSAYLAAPLRKAAAPGPGRQVQQMAAFLRAQRAPYRPTTIQTVRLAGGQIALRVRFLAPSPLGLLAPPVKR